MSYLKLFKISLTFIFLWISLGIAIASNVEGKCGGVIFAVKVIENPNEYESLYTVYYKINAKEKKLLFTPGSEHLSLACVQDNAKRDYLLLEEMCGGSGCTYEGTYTLIDHITKKILVEYTPLPQKNFRGNKLDDLDRRVAHEKKNHKQIANIIGYEPPYLPLSKGKYSMQINLSASPTLEHISIETYGDTERM